MPVPFQPSAVMALVTDARGGEQRRERGMPAAVAPRVRAMLCRSCIEDGSVRGRLQPPQDYYPLSPRNCAQSTMRLARGQFHLRWPALLHWASIASAFRRHYRPPRAPKDLHLASALAAIGFQHSCSCRAYRMPSWSQVLGLMWQYGHVAGHWAGADGAKASGG